MLITPWIFFRSMANLVHESIITRSSVVRKSEEIELHICILKQFLQSVQKEIEGPVALVRHKKKKTKILK